MKSRVGLSAFNGDLMGYLFSQVCVSEFVFSSSIFWGVLCWAGMFSLR